MQRIGTPQVPSLMLEYDHDNEAEFGPCPDCGAQTRRIWGYVYRSDMPYAAYFVEWTPAHQKNDAVFDLIIGNWGDGTGPEDRKMISLLFKVLESGPAFMVQNASARVRLASRGLDRSEVVGQPVADEVFKICDLIYLADPRIAELRS